MTTDPHRSSRVPVRRALLSVSDKSGLVEFARALAHAGAELVSTGGTARALADAGLAVTAVDAITGFPEMMDGRVKTLHPKVHGGLLAVRDNPGHVAAMTEHGIGAIDLLCVSLYPFETTIAREGVTDAEAIEQIDIGGPAMIRSGAKNHASVAVVTDPAQYDAVLEEIAAGGTSLALRRGLAQAAYERTAAYDAAISGYFAKQADEEFPDRLAVAVKKTAELRYGENPHQPASVYVDPAYTGPSVLHAKQLAGKPLSYNNLNDASAALELALAIVRTNPSLVGGEVGASVVKHTNPCGAARATNAVEACRLALAGDPMAAFGGILACSAPIDAASADLIASEGSFFEVVVAPAFDDEAVRTLAARWKNCRLLAIGDSSTSTRAQASVRELKPLPGGMLVQRRDTEVPNPSGWTHAAGPAPTAEQLAAAGVLECIGRALSSNAVCLGGPDGSGARLFGAGAGQMDRVASCRLAIEKAGGLAKGSIAYSDAFFPFPDGPALLADAGVGVIVHPGGSKRDQETFDLCDDRGITVLTTGVRHFRH
ncbi:MAG: phosphoribosylaminoimidazolecarboxamide formyltransferase/IMP cyclohydrolase [Phycisphaerales bacterium]|jgi:phosphoribosylaminoimidazolecarboxamide formyltransferase/IMP cyclohydrolase